MRNLGFLLLVLFSFALKAQKTYIPDDNFEQVLINLNLDDIFDDSVSTAAIDTVTSLYLTNYNIIELVGIEDFVELRSLFCSDNQIVELDLRDNVNLIQVNCRNNQLTSLDVRNGNNLGLWYFTALNNPDLFCIAVDEVANANANWEKDSGCTFSSNCSTSSISELHQAKTLIKILDLFGRPVNTVKKNQPLFYIYDDGTVEKRIVIN